MQLHQYSGVSVHTRHRLGLLVCEASCQLPLPNTNAEALSERDHSMLLECEGGMACHRAVHTHHTASPCMHLIEV